MYEGPIRRVDTVYRGKPTHHYEDATGKRVPGVTTILDKGLPKPALVGWGIKSVAEYAVNERERLADLKPTDMLAELKGSPYKERDAAARRGTEVHRIGEQLVRGEEVIVPDELERHVAHYVEFLDAFNPQPVLVEAVVYHLEHGYAGSLDLVAEVGGERWLLDLKTNRSGVYPETAYQLAAYRFASHYIDADGNERPMLEVDRCAVIHVNEQGWSVVPVQADDAVYKAFRHIAVVYRESERNSAYLGEPLTEVPA